uniref:WAP domain-containing protein n=1 Tax=Gouania willdenowi TaxID=441366 RepID=A0A8C5FZT1_GOUWI
VNIHGDVEKPGSCPSLLIHFGGAPCQKKDKCHHDYDCPEDEKCCIGRCGHECTEIHKGNL